MAFSAGLYLTNVGRMLLAQAQTGTELVFTRVALGDGQLGGQLEIERISLVSEKDSLAITKLQVNNDGTVTVGARRSANDMGGYYFRELGLYAQDPDDTDGEILYGYANAGDSAQALPAAGGAEIVEKIINIIISVGNADNVSATIASGVSITQDDLDYAIANHNHDSLYGPLIFTFNLPTIGWTQNTTTSLYEATAAISGMLAAYNPVADIYAPAASAAVMEAYEDAWALVKGITTAAGSVTIRAESAITVAVPVILKVR